MNTPAQLYLKDGDTIRMVRMGADPHTGKLDPHPIEPGDIGTIIGPGVPLGDGTTQHNVRWKSGRGLGIILPVDMVEKVDG
jgi:hypothetical protein